MDVSSRYNGRYHLDTMDVIISIQWTYHLDKMDQLKKNRNNGLNG